MNEIITRLKKIKIDSLYGKKKHFNAADRKEKLHYWMGIPLIIINVLTGSAIFYTLTYGSTNWLRFVPLILALFASLLSGFQTFINLQKKVEGHKRVGNKFLSVFKKCDRLEAYVRDKAIKENILIKRFEEIAIEIENINKESESFSTNKSDYKTAKFSIENGDEDYTEHELTL